MSYSIVTKLSASKFGYLLFLAKGISILLFYDIRI